LSNHIPTDPELDLAELYLDLGDLFERQYEYWAQASDDEPNPVLRQEMAEIAADAMAIANSARADADDLLRDYD
jgi:hypothetical protein